ncbi:MAG: FAD-dependent thymidylate synthase [Chloroflexi bacterium]|nr:FAD-dependent thymidylate synthase [Chloroflexota bacterium]
MSVRPRVYLLSPKTYPPEVIAVAFAKTSRSPEPFDAIAAELNADQSRRFHEKWVVGYGHASVAEHAVLHIAVEGASRLAVEALEEPRLASYTEKSTRYQRWDADAFVTPPELEAHPLRADYEATLRLLVDTYERAWEPLRAAIARRHPRREGESEARWDRRVRSKFADVARFLLPAAAVANVGITINARLLAHSLRKWLAHPLAEVRQLAQRIKEVALAETPTLVRYAEPNAYRATLRTTWAARSQAVPAPEGFPPNPVHLVHYDPDGEVRVLAAALTHAGRGPYAAYEAHVRGLDAAGRAELAADLLAARGEHDAPPRALEVASTTWDLVMDQGAYYEFKRHRMMTPLPQRLGVDLGYAVPRLLCEVGLMDAYREAMDAAARTYRRLAAALGPEVAAYVVPNAYNRRVLATLNLREAFHLLELRSAANAHFSIRRVALRMAEELAGVYPALMAYLRLPPTTAARLEEEHFAAVAVSPAAG